MNLIVMCNGESSVAAAKYVTYGEGLRAAVTFYLSSGGVTS